MSYWPDHLKSRSKFATSNRYFPDCNVIIVAGRPTIPPPMSDRSIIACAEEVSTKKTHPFIPTRRSESQRTISGSRMRYNEKAALRSMRDIDYAMPPPSAQSRHMQTPSPF